MQQPITNPPVPYTGPIRGGFTPGSMVRIQGQVPPEADRFNINLNCGPPPSDVALHISVRLLQNYIARNSLQNGAWGSEEDGGNLTIAPGQSFEVLILCDPDSYKIAVNGNHFAEFHHRIPFQQVSHLSIDGDVTLGVIAFEGGGGIPSAPAAPPMSGGPDYGYGPPPGQYGPPPPQGPGPYGQGPYGGGPPRPLQASAPRSMPLPNQPPPISMPMPSSVPLPPPAMPSGAPYMSPIPRTTPMYVPPPPPSQIPPYGAPPPSQIPSYGAPPPAQMPPYGAQMPSYGAPPAYIPPPSYQTAYSNMQSYPGYGPPGYPPQNMKKSQLKKAMKYGLPIAGIAGVGLGAYAISQAIGSHSSSSSSSDSD